jgi:hypothetical protein
MEQSGGPYAADDHAISSLIRPGEESRMEAATLVAGAFGLLGAVLGALITLLVSRQNAKQAKELLLRNEFRTAVVEYASAVITFQKTEMDRWHATHGNEPDPQKAAEIDDRGRIARAEAELARHVLTLSTKDDALIRDARQILNDAAAIHHASDDKDMATRAKKVREDVELLVQRAGQLSAKALPS